MSVVHQAVSGVSEADDIANLKVGVAKEDVIARDRDGACIRRLDHLIIRHNEFRLIDGQNHQGTPYFFRQRTILRWALDLPPRRANIRTSSDISRFAQQTSAFPYMNRPVAQLVVGRLCAAIVGRLNY